MIAMGGQTVTVLSYATSGARDNSGMLTAAETSHDVPGCEHRNVPETAVRELKRQYRDVGVVVGAQSWRTTMPFPPPGDPLNPVVLGIKTSDRLVVHGQTYVVMGGALPRWDRAGAPSHVTVISERQETGH